MSIPRHALAAAFLAVAMTSACTPAHHDSFTGDWRLQEYQGILRQVSRAATVTGPLEYEIELGGALDARNTHTYASVYQPGFQPNVELSITNVGDEPVVNPRISINGAGDWFDMNAIVQASIGQAVADTEEARSYALWDFCRRNIDAGPSYNETLWGKTRSVVRFMNCFGSGACGSFHIVMPLIGHAGGLKTASGCLANCCHAIQTEEYDGSRHFFDALLPHGRLDQPRGYVPLELDNRTVAGVVSAKNDHYLIERCGTWPGFYINVAYFGPGDSLHPTKDDELQHERDMGITLRPGESIRRTWTPVKRGWLSEAPSPASSGEGRVVFKPRLTTSALQSDALECKNVQCLAGRALAKGAESAAIRYEIRCPYVVVAAAASARFDLPATGYEQAALSIQPEGADPVEVWRADHPGMVEAHADAENSSAFHKPAFTHRVEFLVLVPPGGSVSELELEVVFQAYVPSLPALRLGSNQIRYVDDTPGPHAIQIDHRWLESSRYRPPPSPSRTVSPPDGGKAGFAPVFEWDQPDGEIADYEIFVSSREDLGWPALAPYHSVVKGSRPRFTPLVADALIHGQRYYWRVRARSIHGVWSGWSPTWSFQAEGPGQPCNPSIARTNGRETLTWNAPQAGTPVDVYEIYADTDCAVSPRREPTTGQVGDKTVELRATLIGTATSRSFELTDRPEVFYRVVAVDQAGSRSVPSPVVSASRPLWLPVDPPAITPGADYSFTPAVRRSTGRWVLKLSEGLVREKVDELRFVMKRGPDWLKIDEASGQLSGRAPDDLAGPVSAALEVSGKDGSPQSRTFQFQIQR